MAAGLTSSILRRFQEHRRRSLKFDTDRQSGQRIAVVISTTRAFFALWTIQNPSYPFIAPRSSRGWRRASLMTAGAAAPSVTAKTMTQPIAMGAGGGRV